MAGWEGCRVLRTPYKVPPDFYYVREGGGKGREGGKGRGRGGVGERGEGRRGRGG